MNNVAGCVEIPLTVYGGENLELSPTDLPQGLSPACQDCAFLPGSVATRPNWQRLDTVGSNYQVVYACHYVRSDGQIQQMRFTSDGTIWAQQNYSSVYAAAAYGKIGQTAAGNHFQAYEAFGKLYIAISDGTQGVDVPLQWDGTNLYRVSQDGPGAGVSVSLVTIPVQSNVGLSRAGNIVTATLPAATTLVPGMQVQVSGVTDLSETISQIVVNNETLAGMATVTTSAAHGFQPGNVVKIANVQPATLPAVTSWETYNAITQFTFASAHGLSVGDTLLAQVGTDSASYGQWSVATVPSTTKVTFITNLGNAGPSSSGSSATLVWPIASGSQFTIQDTPSATTLTVPVSLADGTWTTGNVQYPWNGTFQVLTVSGTVITYRQIGPNATATGAVVTPQGQLAPGIHKVVQIFETAAQEEALTRPSPPVSFEVSGNQFVQVSQLAIGPSNITARYLGFTGAGGDAYFVLPVPPQSSGDPIGTSTFVNDNTTTTAIFDFADDALLNGLAIDAPGQNLFNQVVLGRPYAFHGYADRLIALGDVNKIQQFWNMGFEGGSNDGVNPLGWKITGTVSLAAGDYGPGLSMTSGAVISQGAFQDYLGQAILQPNTAYTARLWLKGSGTVTAQLYSPSKGVLGSATFAANTQGGFQNVPFSAITPVTIPPDAVIQYAANGAVILDELEIFYTLQPFIRVARLSYTINPEAFDDETGRLGRLSDPNPILNVTGLKDVLSLITQGPNGNRYEVEDTASGEPSTWNLRHVESLCGAMSIWGLANFENWFCWASDTGLRISTGGEGDKISQEVQPWFNAITAKQYTVLGNDWNARRLHILAAQGSNIPNVHMVMDYRELSTAGALASSGTLHVSSYSGKVVTSDLTRKWCPWTCQANYCAMIAQPGGAVMTFCGGFGDLGVAGYSATYTLNEGSLSGIDADYGPFWDTSFYTTYAFISAEDAQQKQLSTHRNNHVYLTLNVSGIGTVYPRLFDGNLDNEVTRPNGLPWRAVAVAQDQPTDLQWAFNQISERMFYRIQAQPAGPSPLPAVPAGFFLSQMTLAMKVAAYSPITGWNKVAA